VRALPAAPLAALLAAMLVPISARSDANLAREAPARTLFTETAWPFLLDQWGTGRAFRCDPCGSDLQLYLRAKVGFCNCATGVSDDLEIDRVADFDLFPGRVTPLAPGRPVSVAWMSGRARPFQIDGPGGARRYIFTIALANKCDGVIATVASNEPIAKDFAQAALDELATPPVLNWVAASTGLQ
jgi:hypothetical protein